MKIDFALEEPKQTKQTKQTKKSNKLIPPLSAKQRGEYMRGWYIHCNSTFYVGYGWHSSPPCPKCDKKSKKATWGQVYDEHYYK